MSTLLDNGMIKEAFNLYDIKYCFFFPYSIYILDLNQPPQKKHTQI
jgi:hypothetical protein